MAEIVIRTLEPPDIELLRQIDRSEQLDVVYAVVDGVLEARPDDFFVPSWDLVGTGEHSIQAKLDQWRPYVEGGATLIGAFVAEEIVGLALVERNLRPGLGWLALFYTTRSHRRSGVGKALWAEAVSIVHDGGATAMYVSSAPTGSAVGFYMSRGCRLATTDEIVPELFELEPEDVHLICPL
ncbi:MAG: GNAT family N-acetyltransferase [Acidimicrobiia bacterium]|nr:GNAT family N-acetyltransferase [Acidimicrobiia bacterium]